VIPARPSQLPIAITMGDPAGIGPEIIAKAFREDPAVTAGCFVVGDMATLRRASAVVSGPGRPLIPVAGIDAPQEAYATPPRCIPVLQTPQRLGPVAVGRVSAEAGQAAADCVVWAAQAALRKEIGAIVTAPLHKEALAAAGISYPGHTELLQAQAAAFLGKTVSDVPVRMMLANDELRTVLLSIHVALRDAIDAVTPENLLETLRITHESVGALLQRAPRIGVAGLNPHAGEGGPFWAGRNRHHCADDRNGAKGRHGCQRPFLTGYRLHAGTGSCRRTGGIRCGDCDVPRPGVDSGQVSRR
jgi:4-hydroxythreonine-4-phosphate dehydrogenase